MSTRSLPQEQPDPTSGNPAGERRSVRERRPRRRSSDPFDASRTARGVETAVKRLLRRGGGKALQGVMAKSLAVCSGKGGVGKTITAANLAILYARQGLRVGLVDLDPLSNVAALLDIAEAESALEGAQDLGSGSLDDYRLGVFPNLDLLFPKPKLDRPGREALLEKLFAELPDALQSNYDLLVFDLPAGSDEGENLAFLPFMKLLVLVTNPEPTAHVAAGTYVRRALGRHPGALIRLWHNRYSPNSRGDFDPRDVVGNYNRNVPAEERLRAPQTRRLADLAFVPEDPALNLLRGSPGARENIHRFLIDTLKYTDESRLRLLAQEFELPRAARELLALYLSAHGAVGDCAESLEDFGRYLRVLAARAGRQSAAEEDVFSPGERRALAEYLEKVRDDALRSRLIGLLETLGARLQEIEGSRGPFAPEVGGQANRLVDRELSALLIELSRRVSSAPALVRPGGLLLFYFSLYKLLQSEAVAKLIGRLVPVRQNARGAWVRDRARQIRALIDDDAEYRQKYLKTVRTLYPIVVRQITNMVKVLGLSPLLLRSRNGEILRSAYLKLLTYFLHDTLYSGLSVVVGFPYRASGQAFAEGAKEVLQAMGLPPPPKRPGSPPAP